MVAGSTFIIQKIYHFFLVVKLKCGVALACLSGQNLVHFFLNHSKLLDRAMIIWYIVIKKYKTIRLVYFLNAQHSPWFKNGLRHERGQIKKLDLGG